MKTKLLTITVLLTIALILTPLLPALAANVLLNPGFEDGSGGDADNWTETDMTRTSLRTHSGIYSLVGTLADGYSVTQDVTLTENVTVYFSVWVYVDDTVSCDQASIMLFLTEPAFAYSSVCGQWEWIGNSYMPSTSGTGSLNLFGSAVSIFFDDVCLSTAESDCAEEQPTSTPTATSTETQTPTPTGTFTLTYTPTFTETPTPTSTATETPTPTITNTPTFTRTLMPGPAQTATYEAAVADYIAIGRSQMPVSITVLGLCLVVVLVVIVGGIIWIVSKNRR